VLLNSEKVFDLTGSLTYQATVTYSLYASPALSPLLADPVGTSQKVRARTSESQHAYFPRRSIFVFNYIYRGDQPVFVLLLCDRCSLLCVVPHLHLLPCSPS
jgi:hypothetical protein